MNIESIATDLISLAAVVAAFVSVTRSYGVDRKHSHVIALIIAALFVLVPDAVQKKLLLISVIGLTASGAYEYVKKGERHGDQGN